MANTAETATVIVREVGPRDGLQMAKAVMPTAAKLRWIAAMVAAGVREMEVASFVPPAAMPQMADAAELDFSELAPGTSGLASWAGVDRLLTG